MVAGRRVDEVCIAVIDLVNTTRLCKSNIDRTTLDLARPRRRSLTTLEILPV